MESSLNMKIDMIAAIFVVIRWWGRWTCGTSSQILGSLPMARERRSEAVAVSFDAIKQLVNICDVLQRYGVILKGRGDWRYGKCPLPTHESKESKSFGVNVAQSFWLCHSDSCQANKDGKKGGDVREAWKLAPARARLPFIVGLSLENES